MIQYADFGHDSTPGWCPNVQLYINLEKMKAKFGQASKTNKLSNVYNSLIYNILRKISIFLPPQLKKSSTFVGLIFLSQENVGTKKMIRSSGLIPMTTGFISLTCSSSL